MVSLSGYLWSALIVSMTVIAGLGGVIYRGLNSRVSKLEDKEDKTVKEKNCVAHRDAIADLLERGSEQFKEIRGEQTKQGKMLARIDERVLSLMRKNGIEE